VRSDDWNTKPNAVTAMAQAMLERARHISNHHSIGFEQSHSILIMRVSCFLSNLYNLSCSWSPYPFENMVASDYTFVKKNRVV